MHPHIGLVTSIREEIFHSNDIKYITFFHISYIGDRNCNVLCRVFPLNFYLQLATVSRRCILMALNTLRVRAILALAEIHAIHVRVLAIIT